MSNYFARYPLAVLDQKLRYYNQCLDELARKIRLEKDRIILRELQIAQKDVQSTIDELTQAIKNKVLS